MDDENMDVDRRNIFQLADMVKLKTGSNALKYANYGCYCGIGGKGTPIDNLDRYVLIPSWVDPEGYRGS